MDQKDLVEYIAKSLVDQPEQVQVHEADGEHGKVLRLSVSQEDIGKIIGRQGRIAREIRTVIRAGAQRSNQRVSVDILG